MSTIIAGHFQLQDEIEQARRALVDAGFTPDRISAFYLTEAGQHNESPIGGDHITSPGAKETPEGLAQGAVAGGAVGLAVGAATAPVTGPVGAIVGGLVGAHVGSLFSFSKMKDRGEHETGDVGAENMREPRQAGMLIAVAFDDRTGEARAVDILRGLGAHQIERANGNIVAGDWADFDPTSMPDVIR
ncbi:hypothetical protein [Massilia sp. S19_KUP03_FR1]|uniref:hypothetical protein n=1 Tax=Massilia sp. S19_KUP03_FR1 TaxID=3025503 RepID=UPI002FCDA80E